MYWNELKTPPRVRIKRIHISTRNRRQLCEMQGVEYSYGSLFAEIPPCLLPELFSMMWTESDTRSGKIFGKMDPFRALVATVSSWTSLVVNGRVMVETALERNRVLVKQLNHRSAELEEKLKDIE